MTLCSAKTLKYFVCVILSSLKLCSTILRHLGLPDLWSLSFQLSGTVALCLGSPFLQRDLECNPRQKTKGLPHLFPFFWGNKILYCLLFNFLPVFLLFMMREYVWTLSLDHGLKLKFSYCIFICTLDKNVNLKTGGRDIHVTTISQNNI